MGQNGSKQVKHLAIIAMLAASPALAQQQTIYGPDGVVVGRYTTDTQGTTTLYARDGRVISRGTGTIIMNGPGGTIIRDNHINGKITKDKR
jgi:hypothetical protein